MQATARAHPNIALVKYWGRTDEALNLPATSSLSMTMGGVMTTTTVSVESGLPRDELVLDGKPASEQARERVARHLGRLRALPREAGKGPRPAAEFCRVTSRNNFPQGSGLASSASAFAALTWAANAAMGLGLDARACSVQARMGSGSAARSCFGGWVVWHAGQRSEDSFAEAVAGPEQLDVVDLVAVVSAEHKKVGSSEGHGLAGTSPLHAARVAAVPRILEQALRALQAKDLATLGGLAELDALLMHAVMMTSTPSLLYWQPGTMRVLHAVRGWREEGARCWSTIDAGPNVHILTHAQDAGRVEKGLHALGLGKEQVLRCPPGPGPSLLREPVA
jgi:diphosphomevalonate decarboxylase